MNPEEYTPHNDTTPYEAFLARKSQIGGMHGFAPLIMPDFLFPFQKALVTWALEKGRGALFADCGTGKTPMQLIWAENVVRKTNKPVLIATPLAVSYQTIREANKFDIEAWRSTDGKTRPNITVTNYEQLHKFDPNNFAGMVADESSCIKSFESKRQSIVTDFMRKLPYRLLCSATAAPNDYIELGTSAEALGEMGRMDMLATFFKNEENSLHPIWWGARWRFKAHAETQFWRWVCSWARALRKPSDMGFEDGSFVLPPLIEREIIVKNIRPFTGQLFTMEAITLAEQREERRLTLKERCETVAEKVLQHPCSLSWCHLNDEGDLLEKLIPGSKQVAGADSDDEKEETFKAFVDGTLKYIITKPQIGGFGLNFQHCAHLTFFPSHSWEQYYQGVRRAWRFGQRNPVEVDIITTEGELGVLKNLQRKAEAANIMFDRLVEDMYNALNMPNERTIQRATGVPAWL